jgi:hypothetical protein
MALILYFFGGYYLKSLNTFWDNIISVSTISALLCLVWILNDVLNILTIPLYSIFNFSFFPIYYLLDGNKYVGLILTFLPSLLMWFGLQLKIWREHKKSIASKF